MYNTHDTSNTTLYKQIFDIRSFLLLIIVDELLLEQILKSLRR